MDGWSIRTGTEADVAAVRDLWRAADSPPSPTEGDEPVLQLLRHDPGALLLAEADAAVVGSLVAAWDGWRGSFYRLAVDPGWRRRGIATALVRSGEERLRGLGAVRLTAIAVGSDPEANGLWLAAGYERQSDRARYIRMLPGA